MMPFTSIVRYEFKHFVRSPFKILVILMFLGCAAYGLQNGYELFKKQNAELAAIGSKNQETLDEVTQWYDQGKKGPDDKPWIDVTTPPRALFFAPASAIKKPSLMMPFAVGQAEQFGYYKQVSNRSSVFDADLSEEIANPERLTLGTLDFSFVVLYLLPIVLIVLLFNVGGLEKDLGFDRLIHITQPLYHRWLWARFSFYFLLVALSMLTVMIIYGLITGALGSMTGSFVGLYLFILGYVFIWFLILYLINLIGNGSFGQAIIMVSLWLVFCVVLPGTVHQLSSLKYPASYMTDYLDAAREEAYEVYDLSPATVKSKVLSLYPELKNTLYAKDTVTDVGVIRNSVSGITNQLTKQAARSVEKRNARKNAYLQDIYWINPVSWFQNKLNAMCDTDYTAYRAYRGRIQLLIDKKVELLLWDSWNKETVTKERFYHYLKELENAGAAMPGRI